METRKHNGITYTATTIGNPNGGRKKWDGGIVGGVVFENPAEGFGQASDWRASFDKAAEAAQANYRRGYLRAKKIVDEYEAQLKTAGIDVDAFLTSSAPR